MVIVKATRRSDAGEMPRIELLAAMGGFNEELVKAGVLLAGERLHPSARGKRVHFSGSQRTMSEGPFTKTQELVAGLWLWQAQSMEEAVEWVRRCPNPMDGDSEIEIRPLFEAADFGAELTAEWQARSDSRAPARRSLPAAASRPRACAMRPAFSRCSERPGGVAARTHALPSPVSHTARAAGDEARRQSARHDGDCSALPCAQRSFGGEEGARIARVGMGQRPWERMRQPLRPTSPTSADRPRCCVPSARSAS